MKKFTKIICALVLCLSFLLVACGESLKMPANVSDVSSNGGSVVLVDDYIYFANTFVDHTTLTKGDNDENTGINSIYRIKTVNDSVSYNDEDGKVENLEVVYEKIAGYAASDMFVFGNYLYFTSPNINRDNEGNNNYNLSSLHRVKLDGSDYVENLYTTKTENSMFYVVTAQNPYVLIYDNNQILKLEIKDKANKTTVALASDVTSTVFPENFANISKLYYTTDLSDEETAAGRTGNKLYALDIASGKSTKIAKPDSEEITLVAYEFNTLYFKLLKNNSLFYYSNSFENNAWGNETKLTIVAETEGSEMITDFTVVNKNTVVYKFTVSGNIEIRMNNNLTPLISTDANIEFVSGDYVYYTTTEGLYRISVVDKVAKTLVLSNSIKSGALDFDGDFVYYYANVETNSTGTLYAHRVSTYYAETGNEKIELLSEIKIEDLTNAAETAE